MSDLLDPYQELENVRKIRHCEKSDCMQKSHVFSFFFRSRGSRTKYHDAAGGFDARAGCGGIATQPYILHIALTTLDKTKSLLIVTVKDD